MKRILLWLATVLAAFSVGRRAGTPRPASRPAQGRRRAPWPLLYGIAAGAAEAWRVAAQEHARRMRAGGARGTAGRLGGAAGAAVWGSVASVRETAPGPAPGPQGTADEPSPAVAETQKAADEPAPAARWWQYIQQLFQRFGKDQCPAFAASLSFFGLLSIVPVLLVTLAALGFALDSPEEARRQLENLVARVLPGRAARTAAHDLMNQIKIESQVKTLMESRGWAGIFGVLSLIWASMQIFVNATTAMNAAWEVPENRGWLKLRLVALGLLLGAGSLFLLSLLPSSGPDMVRRLRIPWLGLPEHVPWPVDLLFALVAVAINAAMYTVIYRFLPAAKVTWKQAAVGGIFMGVLWELAKQGFSFYLTTVGSQNAMYGALGGLMILVIWIYYSSMLLLLGAEVAKLYKDICEHRAARQAAPAA